jgi:hypothetical protein
LSLTAGKYSHCFILTFTTSLYFFIIFISSGKAVILYSLLGLIYLLITLHNDKKKLSFFIIIYFFSLLTFHFATVNLKYNNDIKNLNNMKQLTNKFGRNTNIDFTADSILNIYPLIRLYQSRSDLTSRKDIYTEFFINNKLYLDLDNNKMILFFGSGSLTSLISGYHNDYMRLFYRTGLIGMVFSFIPIFYFFSRFLFYSYRNLFFNEKSNIAHLLAVLLGFIPFYSLFSYPREDVFSSGVFFLSLILFFSLIKKNSEYKEYNNS